MDSVRPNNNIKMHPTYIVHPGLLSVLNPNFFAIFRIRLNLPYLNINQLDALNFIMVSSHL